MSGAARTGRGVRCLLRAAALFNQRGNQVEAPGRGYVLAHAFKVQHKLYKNINITFC